MQISIPQPLHQQCAQHPAEGWTRGEEHLVLPVRQCWPLVPYWWWRALWKVPRTWGLWVRSERVVLSKPATALQKIAMKKPLLNAGLSHSASCYWCGVGGSGSYWCYQSSIRGGEIYLSYWLTASLQCKNFNLYFNVFTPIAPFYVCLVVHENFGMTLAV